MKTETVFLREENENIKMRTFIHDDSSNVIAGKRGAMVVLAGGGYLFQANDREGEPVAISYFAAASFVTVLLVMYFISASSSFSLTSIL